MSIFIIYAHIYKKYIQPVAIGYYFAIAKIVLLMPNVIKSIHTT